MDSGSPDPAALRRVGLRVTASRLAVHTALAASAPHSSVDRLVRRIEPTSQSGLYELRIGDIPCLTAPDDSGCEIDEAEVIYWGRCPECVAVTSVLSGEVERTRSVRHQLGDTALDPEQTRSKAISYQKEKDQRV